MSMTEYPDDLATVYDDVIEGSNPILKLLRSYVPGRIATLVTAIVSTVIFRANQIIPPFLLGVALDTFFRGESPGDLSLPLVPSSWIPSSTADQFLFLVGVFFAVSVVTGVAHVVRYLTWNWFQQGIIYDIRTDAYDAAQRLAVEFFDAGETGDVMSVLNNDINQLESLFGTGIRNTIQTVTLIVGLLVAMVLLHWQLAALTIVFVPLLFAIIYGFQRLMQPRKDRSRAVVGSLNTRIQDSISGVETVKSFTNEDYERSKVAGQSRRYWRRQWDVTKLEALFYSVRDLVLRSTNITVLLVGGWWALFGPPLGFTNPVSVGTFVTFYLYSRQFVGTSMGLVGLTDQYTDAMASAKRVYGLMSHPATIDEPEDAVVLDDVEGAVRYEDVSFQYPGTEESVVEDVSFAAEAGDFVGFVGPTGAGKTTMVKLLLRFYEPSRGRIQIDGIDIASVKLDSLREAIGYVSQEPFLFDAPIEENIGYADQSAGGGEIVEAAKRANAHEFITELPDGYETEVGERGVRLSGGQRQRIAIARVFLKDPPILILDEATSHVDNQTELLIQESLSKVVQDRTTFAIAHRLSTVRNADLLLVLDEGRVAERGTHEELLDQEGLYETLWSVHIGETEGATELVGERE